MTVRGFETADGRTLEHGQFGVLPEVGDLEAERLLADVLVGTAADRLLDGSVGARELRVLQGGDLFDVRLDELRAVHEATLPVAFGR